MTAIQPLAGMIEVINARCSVRSYTGRKADRETLNCLLAAAVRAPTAMHAEPWQFVVVQNDFLLQQLSDRAKELFRVELHQARLNSENGSTGAFAAPDFNVFYNAGTLIIICANLTRPFAAADCWLAAENLMLTSCAIGLGSCVIGSAVSAINTEKFKSELGIPSTVTAIAPIIVGYSQTVTPPSARKEAHVLAWH